VKVLWLVAEGQTFALPLRQARRILHGNDPDAAGAIGLLACVRGERAPAARPAEHRRAALAIELEPARGEVRPAVIGVDAVGAIEEVALRGVSPLIATAGPYAGAIVRGAELRLCLDPHGLAEAARDAG
jgi:hypothetical protein